MMSAAAVWPARGAHGNWVIEYALLTKTAISARVTEFSGQYRSGLAAHPVVIPSW